MGKLSKKIGKGILVSDPLNIIHAILNYKGMKIDSKNVFKICDKLHLSVYTFYYLHSMDFPEISVDLAFMNKAPLTTTQKNDKTFLGKKMKACYDGMVKGYKDKITEIKRVAGMLSTKEGMKNPNNELEKKRQQKGGGLIHSLPSLSFAKETNSKFIFENFRWILGMIHKNANAILMNPEIALNNTTLDKIDINNPATATKCRFHNIPKGIFKNLVDKGFLRIYYTLFKFTNTNTLIITEYDNMYKKYNKDFNDPSTYTAFIYLFPYIDVQYNYKTKLEEYDSVIFAILGYIWGINSTFLEGKDIHPYLFEGITGENFRVEHIRMKLIKMLAEGRFNTEDEFVMKHLIQFIANPFKYWDRLREFCEVYNINIKALSGMYQELENGKTDTMMTTPQFKQTLEHYNDFIRFE